MDLFDFVQIFLLIFALVLLVPFLGAYMAKVFRGEETFLHPLLRPLENLSYRLAKINSHEEMDWKKYLKALLLFNLFGFLALLLIQLFQNAMPFNPQDFGSVPFALALNTALSFTTNTNWQAYAGETTMSYGTQMFGLTVQNFLSAATGNTALLALIRGITGKSGVGIGNFWVDMVRTVIYLLLPLSAIFACVLVSQGVVQSLSGYVQAETLEGATQTIPLGPAASQIAIKQLGTNGGGFFATNSAHPFENPNPVTNFLELIAILLIPAATTYMYGSLTGERKHGWLIFSAMLIVWGLGLALALYSEHLNNPLVNANPLLEGKETRIGVTNSILWAVSTTAIANGSVNAMLCSFSPLSGGVALFNIMLGELVFVGIGTGLCHMLMLVFLTIFLAGLMVGRTPGYLGKNIGKKEMQWVCIAILLPSTLILIGAGFSCIYPPALTSVGNRGPHGLSEILYAFSSSAATNGSAFAGLNANTVFYNVNLGICMILGRLSILVPSIVIAGTLAPKKILPVTKGVFSTNTLLFLSVLVGVMLIVGALTFFPALCLGPIVEHFLMLKGVAFS